MIPSSSWTLRPAAPIALARASAVATTRYMHPVLWEELLTAFHSDDSDATIARNLHVPVLSVWYTRGNLGVPASATRREELSTQLVGQVPDAVVAAWLGTGHDNIRAFRELHQIPEYDRDRKPTDSEILRSALVATKAAKLLGVSAERIREVRKHNVPLRPEPVVKPVRAPKPPKNLSRINWAEVPFGTVSDAELSRRLKIDRGAVGKRRRAAGAPRFVPTWDRGISSVDWFSLPLFTKSLNALVLLTGVSKTTVRRARAAYLAGTLTSKSAVSEIALTPLPVKPPPSTSVNWAEVTFGTMSDEDLADQLGVHRSTVSLRRRAAGVPAFTSATGGSKSVDWDSLPLFTATIGELARLSGMSKTTVRRIRAARLAAS